MEEENQSATLAGGSDFVIRPVRDESDLKATIDLFYEYIEWLDLDLGFQGLDLEMASMPGKYAAPAGELLLARSGDGIAAGCVAFRRLDDSICEMKRLWVRDLAKGTGLGRKLVARIIEAARDAGYHKMRLDTLPRMEAARRLYQAFGFVIVEAYYATPLEGTIFLELDLTKHV